MARSLRIDVHHHIFPSGSRRSVHRDPIGYHFPPENIPWTPEISLRTMDALGIDLAVLSVPTGLPDPPAGPDNRRSARELNEMLANICKDHPDRFGWFAATPLLTDTEAALAEIAYALDVLGADGVGLASSYGLGKDAVYVGDDRLDPIWQELDRRGVAVHLHGAQTPSSTHWPDKTLGLPISEVPNETYKAAAHLVVTGKKRRYANVKIILSHLGGSSLILAPRVAVLSHHMGSLLTPEEILADFKTFYVDTALTAYETTLQTAKNFLPPDHVLFGTDFPAISKDMAAWYQKNIEQFYNDNELKAVLSDNILKLMPGLQKRIARA
ncbi:amidohydrolase 2 [Daedalea quercina L-15889]|uniref:Amidohydrolase 2 n=1 Tax=Daedalea quercina L-15889 TaxID=1314783 RepID=A0A165U3L7_9APHY|nr:amidohydrolase 2 [Daedalea quercina L-15889]